MSDYKRLVYCCNHPYIPDTRGVICDAADQTDGLLKVSTPFGIFLIAERFLYPAKPILLTKSIIDDAELKPSCLFITARGSLSVIFFVKTFIDSFWCVIPCSINTKSQQPAGVTDAITPITNLENLSYYRTHSFGVQQDGLFLNDNPDGLPVSSMLGSDSKAVIAEASTYAHFLFKKCCHEIESIDFQTDVMSLLLSNSRVALLHRMRP